MCCWRLLLARSPVRVLGSSPTPRPKTGLANHRPHIMPVYSVNLSGGEEGEKHCCCYHTAATLLTGCPGRGGGAAPPPLAPGYPDADPAPLPRHAASTSAAVATAVVGPRRLRDQCMLLYGKGVPQRKQREDKWRAPGDRPRSEGATPAVLARLYVRNQSTPWNFLVPFPPALLPWGVHAAVDSGGAENAGVQLYQRRCIWTYVRCSCTCCERWSSTLAYLTTAGPLLEPTPPDTDPSFSIRRCWPSRASPVTERGVREPANREFFQRG